MIMAMVDLVKGTGKDRVHPLQKSGHIVYTREMPWMETNAIEQRLGFVHDCESGQWTMAELCERYRVSRPTGYKWLKRFRDEGKDGVVERIRMPRSCPHRTSARVEAMILEARREYGWGAKKLRLVLAKRHPKIRGLQ
jgi:putative transposase